LVPSVGSSIASIGSSIMFHSIAFIDSSTNCSSIPSLDSSTARFSIASLDSSTARSSIASIGASIPSVCSSIAFVYSSIILPPRNCIFRFTIIF
jgi:hypothetical protein